MTDRTEDRLNTLRLELARGKTPAELWPYADMLGIADRAAEVLGPREAAGPPPPRPAPRPQSASPVPQSGPGTELARLLAEVGLTARAGCNCPLRVAEMNQRSPVWCREHVAEVAGWLKEAAVKAGWLTAVAVAPALLRQPWFRVLAPFESIVLEAVRRAEAQPPS